jgi:8-oxo-dGTP pyrophosphatase MutT (NUDIX family)
MEERFDVCGPDGVPTGEALPRGEVHRRGLWHRSAHLWLTDGRRLLLQQRHPAKETDPGRWDIAVAGHLSAGQTPLEALLREAREELGLALDPASLTPLGAWPKEYFEPGFVDREWQHVFAGFWSGDPASLTLQADEVVDARWMDIRAWRRVQVSRDEGYVDRRGDWPAFETWLAARAV